MSDQGQISSPIKEDLEKSRSRSPSRSRSRSKSPRRSPSPQSRSRSRSPSKSRSPSPKRRRYSRSPSPKRRRSYSRSRSRSPRRRRSYSRSPPRRGGGGFRPAKQESAPSAVLGLFNLSLEVRERDLKDFFDPVAKCDRVCIVYDRHSQKSKGFAFCYFASVEDATAIKNELSGKTLFGRPVRIDFSTTKKPHDPTPGMYVGFIRDPKRRAEERDRLARRSRSPPRRREYRDRSRSPRRSFSPRRRSFSRSPRRSFSRSRSRSPYRR